MKVLSSADILEVLASLSAIATAIIAAIAYGRYTWERGRKVRRLEQYLRNEKEQDLDMGRRSILHLMAHLRMSESDLLDAAFRSKSVACVTPVNWQGRADALMFEYVGVDTPMLQQRRRQ